MDLEDEIRKTRETWKATREKRLAVKKQLLQQGKEKRTIRKDPACRELKKQQQYLFTRIKHLEKKLNRKRSNTARHSSKD